jgi:carbonic anhydrase/acetyltransferase-like protein (isoleucine patch superfamily)
MGDDYRGQNILPFNDVWPKIETDAFVAPNATVVGDVEIGNATGVWFGCVVRGDVQPIRIGQGTNIQDGAVLHATSGMVPTLIGAGVTVGHQAILHGCTLEDGCFVGMQACIMDGAVVAGGAMVAAGALVTPGKQIAGGELWGGSPARMMRQLSAEESAYINDSAAHYVELAKTYQASVSGRKSMAGEP